MNDECKDSDTELKTWTTSTRRMKSVARVTRRRGGGSRGGVQDDESRVCGKISCTAQINYRLLTWPRKLMSMNCSRP